MREYFQKVIDWNFWDGTLDKTISFIYEEFLKIFQRVNLSPCTFDLLKLKLKIMKLKMNETVLTLTFCQGGSFKLDICQKCTKSFVFEEKHGRITDEKFTNICLKKKKMNKWNLDFLYLIMTVSFHLIDIMSVAVSSLKNLKILVVSIKIFATSLPIST